MTDAPLPDVPNDVSTTASIAVGGSVEGVVDSRFDRDWFRVFLQPGATYRADISMVGAPESYVGAYTRMFPESEAGAPYSSSHLFERGVTGSGVEVSEAGAYIIAVRGWYARDEYAEYVLTLNAVADDAPASPDTTLAVTPGTPHRGFAEIPYDHDWVRAPVDAGAVYRIDVRNPARPDEAFKGRLDL